MKKKYTWNPDLPDQRDYQFTASITGSLPTSTDLRKAMPPIYDQGNLGSCTANSVAGAAEFLLKKEKKSDFMPSRLFIYYNERMIEGTINQDSGAALRDGVKVLNKYGVCDELIWPYKISKFKNKPTNTCYTKALLNEAVSYSRITNSVNDMKSCLAQGYPFMFGFTVYDSFESAAVAKTGIVPMPSKTEKVLGGHAVLAVGYDDSKQWFIVRNSWGSGWGDKGYFYMPYQYISNSNLVDDRWVVTVLS